MHAFIHSFIHSFLSVCSTLSVGSVYLFGVSSATSDTRNRTSQDKGTCICRDRTRPNPKGFGFLRGAQSFFSSLCVYRHLSMHQSISLSTTTWTWQAGTTWSRMILFSAVGCGRTFGQRRHSTEPASNQSGSVPVFFSIFGHASGVALSLSLSPAT